MVVEGHRDAEIGHAQGKLRQFGAIAAPFLVAKNGPHRNRLPYTVGAAPGGVCINDIRSTAIAQQGEVRAQGPKFRLHVGFRQAAIPPAADQAEAEPIEYF